MPKNSNETCNALKKMDDAVEMNKMMDENCQYNGTLFTNEAAKQEFDTIFEGCINQKDCTLDFFEKFEKENLFS